MIPLHYRRCNWLMRRMIDTAMSCVVSVGTPPIRSFRCGERCPGDGVSCQAFPTISTMLAGHAAAAMKLASDCRMPVRFFYVEAGCSRLFLLLDLLLARVAAVTFASTASAASQFKCCCCRLVLLLLLLLLLLQDIRFFVQQEFGVLCGQQILGCACGDI